MKSYFKMQLLAIALLNIGSMVHGIVKEINNLEEFRALTNAKVCCVKIAAEWCGACKLVKDPFIRVSNQPEFSHITFAHADLDQNRALAQQYGVQGVPTLLYITADGKVDKSVGVKGNDIEQYLSNELRTKLPKAANVGASADAEGSVTTEETTLNPVTGTETTTKEVTTEQVQGDAEVVTQETTTTSQDAQTSTLSFLGKIKALFLWMFNSVRDVFVGIFNWIKSLFGK